MGIMSNQAIIYLKKKDIKNWAAFKDIAKKRECSASSIINRFIKETVKQEG